MKKVKLSKTSTMHYSKLVFRSCLMLWAVFTFIKYKRLHTVSFKSAAPEYWPILAFVWIVFMVEMIFRLLPSSIESMGCQKQFKRNYIPTKNADNENPAWGDKTTIYAALSWIGLNGIIAVLYFTGVIRDGLLFIIALFYSVSDMICILFFCPFQSWIMKNRCCTVCRIYNWDYFMMFTPLLFIKSWYTWSLVGASLIILIRWELTAYLHPERFSEKCNANLKCENCKEKLCHHKTQLHRLWQKERDYIKSKL